MKVCYSLNIDNMYMYRIPLFQGLNKLRLCKIVVEGEEQTIEPIDWDILCDNDYMRYVLRNYSKDIDVYYE